jgi:hypothetical protein
VPGIGQGAHEVHDVFRLYVVGCTLLTQPLSMLSPFALSLSKGAAGTGLRQAQPERLAVTLRAGLIVRAVVSHAR